MGTTSADLADGASPRTAFVLAGGGFKGAFELGALHHLVHVLGVTPDVITSASAGSILGMVLAQARTHDELCARLVDARDDLMAMTQVDMVFGEQPWLEELRGTPAADAIRRLVTERTTPALPGGIPDPDEPDTTDGAGEAGRGGEAGADGDIDGDGDVDFADKLSHLRSRWSEIAAVARRIPAANRARKESEQRYGTLNLDPFEDAIRGRADVGIAPVDPALVARPGLDLRMAVTAVKAREVRYVCGDGTLVGPDALTPVPEPDAGGDDEGDDDADDEARDGGDDEEERTDPVAFDLIDGAIASSSVPGVFPARVLGLESYVDGGVLQNIPLAAAVILGAERIFTIIAVPVLEPQRSMSLWAAKELGFVATQQDNLAVTLPEGTTNTLIEPTLEVVGSFEVHRGLMAIDIDYGRMRAEEALAGLDDGLEPIVTEASDTITLLRGKAWHLEQRCLDDGEVSAARLDTLRALKASVRSAVAARTALGFPAAPEAREWGRGWELHSAPLPDAFPASFA